jgi:hypothetical protein
MKWLEMIRVQAAGDGVEMVRTEISCLLQKALKNGHEVGLRDLTFHVHASIPWYVAIHLFWDTESPQLQGTATGLSLTQLLKSFCLVDHSVWVTLGPGRQGDPCGPTGKNNPMKSPIKGGEHGDI